MNDICTQFNFEIPQEVAVILEVEFKQASTNNAQTIGMLERSHATIKPHWVTATGVFRNN